MSWRFIDKLSENTHLRTAQQHDRFQPHLEKNATQWHSSVHHVQHKINATLTTHGRKRGLQSCAIKIPPNAATIYKVFKFFVQKWQIVAVKIVTTSSQINVDCHPMRSRFFTCTQVPDKSFRPTDSLWRFVASKHTKKN